MILNYQGKEYDFDQAKITIDEWRELKRKYKMTPKAFEEGVSEADPDASTFLYWIMLRQAGDQRTTLGDHLRPDLLALNEAIAKAEPDEGEDGDEPDPTPGSASPPGMTSASVSPPAPPSPPAQPQGVIPAPTA